MKSVRVIGVTAVVALSCVVMGPFGTFSAMTPLQRIPFWVVLVFGSLAIGISVRAAVARVLSNRSARWRIPAYAVIGGAIMTPLIYLWTRVVAGPDYEMRLATAELYATCVLAFGLIEASLQLPDRSAQTGGDSPRLRRRLEQAGAAPIIHLTVDDHYVEVKQADGRHSRILMRLTDAIDEMDGIDGFSVHRSHWVALHHIRTTHREKGRDVLELSDGTIVPVSRTYRPNLVKAGFLEPRD